MQHEIFVDITSTDTEYILNIDKQIAGEDAIFLYHCIKQQDIFRKQILNYM